MNDRKLKIEEVAINLGVSTQTINVWYRWKRQNPDNEYAQLLPPYSQEGGRQTRYWLITDIEKLEKFKNSIPQGCKGIMGDVTQKYLKKEKDDGKN